MNGRRAPLATAAILATIAAGCGEKPEPTPSELDEQARAAAEEVDADLPITGTWRGELRQKGLKPFRIVARITGPDGPNRVRYGGIDCSGRWRFEGSTDGEFGFHEEIERGKGGKCKGSGTVTLAREGREGLAYEFRGGGVESRGTLRRVG